MIFTNGFFSPDQVGDRRAAAVLRAAVDRAAGPIRPSDLLAASIASGDAKILATLGQALQPGATPADLLEVIGIYNPPRTSPTRFDGRRERFSPEALAALDQLADALPDGGEGVGEVALELLVRCVLDHLDDEDRDFLTSLDSARGAALFAQQAQVAGEPPSPLFDGATGRLRTEELSEGATTTMEHATIRAADLGYERVMPPHCFLAILGETEGVAEHLVRLQAQPDVGPAKVGAIVAETFRLGERKSAPPELTRDGLSESTGDLLRAAQKATRLWGAERIDTTHLLLALLDDTPPRLASILSSSPLSLDLRKMRTQLEQYLREERTHAKREVAFKLPPGSLPSEDLTYRARTDGFPAALHVEPYFDRLTRALFRRANNHVVITGLRGVGKTALVWELARRAALGEIPFLRRKRFLWVNAGDVPPDESRNRLNAILGHVAGRTDLILCLDGLGPLLRGESGANNKVPLRAALKDARAHVIGVLSNAEYEDLLSADHELLEFFTRVEVQEPEGDAALDIVRQAAGRLAEEYKVTIEDRAIDRAVVLSSSFILNERLPTKAIKILRRVCENVDYGRTQKNDERSAITGSDVVEVIAEISGVPITTLLGEAGEVNYKDALSAVVVGQEEAVKAVATELGLIKAGLTRPKKPASVMLFAGLTGVGKTELAKAVAQLYSSSKVLQTYTMGNYTEAHSISAIIGVPPGYVGHDQGGRIINDLNSDPYCVLLLDEADKPHPDVWKPFLNLFDEGWITDQRGVKAFGDRAIFILTTNAGQELISELSKDGAQQEEIVPRVREALLQARHPNSNQPVFSPEFLARITRILIFRPLDEAAMAGICWKMVRQMEGDWLERREKTLKIPKELVAYVAAEAHRQDEASGFKEGGRIVGKLLNDLVQAEIQEAASKQASTFRESNVVELVFLPPGPLLPLQKEAPQPKVTVVFRSEPPPSPADCLARAVTELQQLARAGSSVGQISQEEVAACLARLEASLKRARPIGDETANGTDLARLTPDVERFRQTCAEIERRSQQAAQDTRALVEKLIAALDPAPPVAPPEPAAEGRSG